MPLLLFLLLVTPSLATFFGCTPCGGGGGGGGGGCGASGCSLAGGIGGSCASSASAFGPCPAPAPSACPSYPPCPPLQAAASSAAAFSFGSPTYLFQQQQQPQIFTQQSSSAFFEPRTNIQAQPEQIFQAESQPSQERVVLGTSQPQPQQQQPLVQQLIYGADGQPQLVPASINSNPAVYRAVQQAVNLAQHSTGSDAYVVTAGGGGGGGGGGGAAYANPDASYKTNDVSLFYDDKQRMPTQTIDEIDMKALEWGIPLRPADTPKATIDAIERLAEEAERQALAAGAARPGYVVGGEKAHRRTRRSVRSRRRPVSAERGTSAERLLDVEGATTESTVQSPIDAKKCNNIVLHDIMRKAMSTSTSASKRAVNRAAEAEFGGPVDVICSRGHFSYVFSSNLFCEVYKDGLTCVAFRQALPEELTSEESDEYDH